MNTDKPIRISLIGCGNHSEFHHGPAMRKFAIDNPGTIQLCGVCDINAERTDKFCRDFGFESAFSDIDEMLSKTKSDAVISTPPIMLNVEIATKLLESGKTSLLEKPIGENLAQAHALKAVAEKTATPHMISMNRRFFPVLRQASNWLAGRKIDYIRVSILRNKRTEPRFICDTAIHPLDAMTSLAGPVKDFRVSTVDSASLACRWYQVDMDFETCPGSLLVAPSCGITEERYELFGSNFNVKFAMFGENHGYVECWEDGKLAFRSDLDENSPRFVRNGAYDEFCHFVAAMQGKKAFCPTIDDVLNPSECCFALAEQFGL